MRFARLLGRSVVGAMVGTAWMAASASAGLRIFSEEAPPLNYLKDGKAAGVAVEVVQEIQKRIGDHTLIEMVPWARGYKAAQEEVDVALFSTTRTDEREKLFKWVGPIATKNWVFVKKKGSAVKVSSLDEAKKLTAIGTYAEDAKEQFLKKSGFTNLSSVPKDDLNIRKLVAGRIDLWLTGEGDIKGYAAQAGVDPSEVEVAMVVQKKELYIAFSPKTSDEIIKKWQGAYDAMVKDGTYAKLHAASR